MNFQDELAKRTEETEKVIRSFLPAEAGFAGTMAQAMNYSMLAGGKRLRPMLIRETYRLFDGKEEVVKPFMAGMEMIHTHSLIHDDLPALDDDDYRRGRLTTHKVYGEAMGVLSGVALLNYAYETMFQAFALTKEQDRVIHALRVVSQKTGIHGMLGGQSVDVENDGKPLGKDKDSFGLLHLSHCFQNSLRRQLFNGVADFQQRFIENLIYIHRILPGLCFLSQHIPQLRKASDTAFFYGAGNCSRR